MVITRTLTNTAVSLSSELVSYTGNEIAIEIPRRLLGNPPPPAIEIQISTPLKAVGRDN